MKILIIGANGMLGHDLISEFKTSHQVIGWDKEHIDITDKKSAEQKICSLKPDAVINAAAFTNVDGSEDKKIKKLIMAVNGKGPGYLAKICAKLNIPLIHYSTDYVFNGKNKKGYRENYYNINPINAYGKSKALGEKLIRKNAKKFYILRTSWLYGRHGKNFVDTMLKLARTNKELRIVNDQHGKPTYSLDLAKRTREILEQKKPFGIYHVINENETTWYKFAKQIFKLKKVKIKVNSCSSKEFKSPTNRPEYSTLINTKLTPLRSWQKALKEYLLKNIKT